MARLFPAQLFMICFRFPAWRLLSLVLLLPFGVSGQSDSLETGDSLVQVKVSGRLVVRTLYLFEDSVLYKPKRYTRIDTSLELNRLRPETEFLDYWAINNFGSALYPLSYDRMRAPGFFLGYRALRPYLFEFENLKYFDSYTPYTQFEYKQGAGEMQLFNAWHSRNIGPNLNLSVSYKASRADGFYQNSAHRGSRLGFNTRYEQEEGKYLILGGLMWNTIENGLNGGVLNIESFNGMSPRQRLTQPIRLDNAGESFRNFSFRLRSIRYMGKMDSVAINDSTKVGRITPRLYFTHAIQYQRTNFRFTADTNEYFDTTFFGFDKILQSTLARTWTNELGAGIFLNNKDILEDDSLSRLSTYPEQVFYAGLRINNGRAGYYNLATLENPTDYWQNDAFFNLHLFANLSKNITDYTHLKASFDYVAVGNNFSDYALDASLQQMLFKGLFLKPWLRARAIGPSYLMQRYQSAFGNWDNDFRKEFHNELGAKLSYRGRYNFIVRARRSDRLIYLNEEAVPSQLESGLNFLSAEARHDTRIGKFFISHVLRWQRINRESPFAIPEWLAYGHYRFEGLMYKGAARVRLGVKVRYFSDFEANEYVPGLGDFKPQTARTVGNYPFVDVYLSALVKRWNGFLMYEHVSEGLLDYTYEMLPYYPLYPRALRMGVAWRFYD